MSKILSNLLFYIFITLSTTYGLHGIQTLDVHDLLITVFPLIKRHPPINIALGKGKVK